MTWGDPPPFIAKQLNKAKAVTSEQLAASGSEDGHQMAVFAWAASMCGQYPQLKWMHAIPNGGSRHIVEATKMVAAGLRTGVLDIFLPVWKIGDRKVYHGLYIELKTEKRRNKKNGGLTDEQIEFIEYAESAGYYCKVCYNWIEARDIILNYLEGRL